ncbi:MAG: protein phosphatase 2C domain-containing protein [Acidobacteriota bacterium]
MKNKFIKSVSHIGTGFRNWDRTGVSVDNRSLLAVLADGVGGHINGGVAAEMAVEKFKSLHVNKIFDPGLINKYFKELSLEMRNVNLEMATTIILVYIIQKGKKLEMIYTWAGDSRLFLLTQNNRRLRKGAAAGRGDNGNLYILSEDDTIPWRYFMNGEIELDQVTTSSGKNRLFFSLPRDGDRMKGRIIKMKVSYGDKILLCSDGFWERFKNQSEIGKWMGIRPVNFGNRFDKFMDNESREGTKVDNSTCIKIDLDEDLFIKHRE